MNLLIRIWEKLRNKEYREGYTEAQFSVRLPFQIQALREKRGWTQAELAKRMGTSQNQISQIEQVGIGPRSLKMLYKLCSALDISLLVQFVSFRDLVSHVEKFDIETFNVNSFSDDQQYEYSNAPIPYDTFGHKTEEYAMWLTAGAKLAGSPNKNLITRRLVFSTSKGAVKGSGIIYHYGSWDRPAPNIRKFSYTDSGVFVTQGRIP